MNKQRQNKIVKIAKSLLGVPYKYGAKPEDAPNILDCSLLIQYIFGKENILLPRSSIYQATKGREVKIVDEEWRLTPADLLFWRGTKGHYDDALFGGLPLCIGHVALYIGDGKIIHANGKTKSVAETDLSEIKEPMVMVRRIL